MIELVLMGVCIALNALLALTEMAFVSVSRMQLRRLATEGNRRAQRVLKLRDNPERTLSILQVGITLVGAVAAAAGGASIEDIISPILEHKYGLSENIAEVLGIVFIVIPLTYLSVVVGELVPKALALRNPLRIVLGVSKWLAIADRFLTPLISVLEWSTKKILVIFMPRTSLQYQTSEEESLPIDHLATPHRQYVLNIVNLDKKRIKDIFIPLKQVTFITSDLSATQVTSILLESGYTRLPIMEKGQIIGFLHSKEFLAFRAKGLDDWLTTARPALTITTQDTLFKALRLMQDNKSHMLVVYERNQQLGIVTLEDIFEEIVGDIYDEDEDDSFKRLLSMGSTLRAPRPPDYSKTHI